MWWAVALAYVRWPGIVFSLWNIEKSRHNTLKLGPVNEHTVSSDIFLQQKVPMTL